MKLCIMDDFRTVTLNNYRLTEGKMYGIRQPHYEYEVSVDNILNAIGVEQITNWLKNR